jgi:hypothetical protein
MRKLAFLVAFPLVASVALAQQPPPPDHKTPSAPSAPAKAETKEMAAQVVAIDPAGKTITVKKDSAASTDPAAAKETTLPVEADAVAALKTVTSGQKVKLTCRTNNLGKETAVIAIQKVVKPMSNPE